VGSDMAVPAEVTGLSCQSCLIVRRRELGVVLRIVIGNHNGAGITGPKSKRVIRRQQVVRTRRPELQDRSYLNAPWQISSSADGDMMAFIVCCWTKLKLREWVSRITRIVTE